MAKIRVAGHPGHSPGQFIELLMHDAGDASSGKLVAVADGRPQLALLLPGD
jgi:hypothetical protein